MRSLNNLENSWLLITLNSCSSVDFQWCFIEFFLWKTLMHYFNVSSFWKAWWEIFSKLNIFLKIHQSVLFESEVYTQFIMLCVLFSHLCGLSLGMWWWLFTSMVVDRFNLKLCLVFMRCSMSQGHWNLFYLVEDFFMLKECFMFKDCINKRLSKPWVGIMILFKLIYWV